MRVYGSVTRVSADESDTYFHKRPRESQLAAHASDPQSAPIESRAALEAKLGALEAQYPEGHEVPRPDFWGGYRIVPQEWEFWQGRAQPDARPLRVPPGRRGLDHRAADALSAPRPQLLDR